MLDTIRILPQEIGTRWVEAGETVVLQAPSAIVPGEHNFLLNPRHPDFGRLAIGDPEPFVLDERLVGPSSGGRRTQRPLSKLSPARSVSTTCVPTPPPPLPHGLQLGSAHTVRPFLAERISETRGLRDVR